MKDLPAIYAHFNNADKKGRLRRSRVSTEEDLARLDIEPIEGMEIHRPAWTHVTQRHYFTCAR
jgi:hypothetical protein